MTQLILYTSEEGKSRIQLRADGQTVWLTQREMAGLFQISKQNVAKRLKAIFTDQELSEEAVANQWSTTAVDALDEAEPKALENRIKHRTDKSS